MLGMMEMVSARGHPSRFPLQVADVLVVEVDVHEAAELALVREKMPAQLGVLPSQGSQQITHRAAV